MNETYMNRDDLANPCAQRHGMAQVRQHFRAAV